MHSFSCIALNLTIRAGQLRATRTWIQSVLSPSPDYGKSASSTLTASSQKSRPCLNTIDPESLQRELLLQISDFSVLFRTLQWFMDIYIYLYLVYCRILKYISFAQKIR